MATSSARRAKMAPIACNAVYGAMVWYRQHKLIAVNVLECRHDTTLGTPLLAAGVLNQRCVGLRSCWRRTAEVASAIVYCFCFGLCDGCIFVVFSVEVSVTADDDGDQNGHRCTKEDISVVVAQVFLSFCCRDLYGRYLCCAHIVLL